MPRLQGVYVCKPIVSKSSAHATFSTTNRAGSLAHQLGRSTGRLPSFRCALLSLASAVVLTGDARPTTWSLQTQALAVGKTP